ncbi:LLM class flavin-dependent oxidoreductase [Streptomyces sp. NBC_01716]|nr:LLM class flavin-dependent oxidoreductase [Streptomyces sp. NBC_01716]
MVARTAATLDIISGGRFELGLATGAQQLRKPGGHRAPYAADTTSREASPTAPDSWRALRGHGSSS